MTNSELPERDDVRLGWILPDQAFISDPELEAVGIVRPYSMQAEDLWRLIMDNVEACRESPVRVEVEECNGRVIRLGVLGVKHLV